MSTPGTLARSPLSPAWTEASRWQVASPEDLGTLRAHLRRALAASRGRAPWPEDAVDDVVLVASELATNAVRHATGPVWVRLLCDGAGVVVDVVDHDPAAEPAVAPSGRPGGGGFGLVLARRLAQDVGWFTTPRGRKHVWARFATPAPPRATATPTA